MHTYQLCALVCSAEPPYIFTIRRLFSGTSNVSFLIDIGTGIHGNQSEHVWTYSWGSEKWGVRVSRFPCGRGWGQVRGKGSHVNNFEQVMTVADPVAGWGQETWTLCGHLWWPSFYDLYLQGQKGPGGAPRPPLDLLLHRHLERRPPTPNPYVQIEW